MSREITHAIEIPGRGKVYGRDWIRKNPEFWQRLIREMRDSGGTAICRCPGSVLGAPSEPRHPAASAYHRGTILNLGLPEPPSTA